MGAVESELKYFRDTRDAYRREIMSTENEIKALRCEIRGIRETRPMFPVHSLSGRLGSKEKKLKKMNNNYKCMGFEPLQSGWDYE
jgi:hypothetical protein